MDTVRVTLAMNEKKYRQNLFKLVRKVPWNPLKRKKTNKYYNENTENILI